MKLDSSPDTDSTSENTYSPFEENSDNVTFCHCHKYKVDVTTFKDAVEIFKDDIKTLKERIYIKRRQVITYLKIKASLSENDLSFMSILPKVIKMIKKLSYKVHISEINVLGYL